MKTSLERADLYVRRTHKLLREARMALLSMGAFEETTVKDICERTMVHRTTFYKHYEDKCALVAEEEHVPPNAFSMDHPPPYFIRLFEHVAEHQQFYKLMLCGEGIGRFQKLVKDYIAKVAEAKWREWAPANQKSIVPLAMYAQFLAVAVLSLLAW